MVLNVAPMIKKTTPIEESIIGAVHPWNTHLGTEEYEPDARSLNKKTRRIPLLECEALGLFTGKMKFFPLYLLSRMSRFI
jgi:hypothetical protein